VGRPTVLKRPIRHSDRSGDGRPTAMMRPARESAAARAAASEAATAAASEAVPVGGIRVAIYQ
jgi:hypothetical protein